MRGIISFLPVTFGIIFFIILLAFLRTEKLPSRSPANKLEEDNKPRVSLKDLKIVGWTAYWDEKNTLAALPSSIGRFAIFTPVLYRVEPNGSLGKYTVLYKEEFLEIARAKNIPIMPQIGDDFDFKRVSLLINDSKLQDEFVQSMVEEARKEKFVGWDIDIESLKIKDQEAFTQFVQKLARALHQNNLKLSITVFARTGNDNHEPALAQDYRKIGRVANEVRIMMYGTHDEDTEPGGQAPLEWMRQVLNYATKNIPREKIVVGLSTHGYDWNNDTAEPLTFRQIENRIGEATASVRFDKEASSAVFEYHKDDGKHVIWFENSQAIIQKVLLSLEEFGITKFALWRIGAEDPRLWDTFNQLKF